MEKAALDEKKRKASALTETKKRPSPDDTSGDLKRPKLEPDTATATPPPTSSSILATFDFTTLPASLITDLIVANLEAFSEPTLIELVQTYRQSRGLLNVTAPAPAPASSIAVPLPSAAASSPSAPSGPKKGPTSITQPVASGSTPPPPSGPRVVKEEPVDPLQMDIDQDEMEYEPDRLNEQVGALSLV